MLMDTLEFFSDIKIKSKQQYICLHFCINDIESLPFIVLTRANFGFI